MTLESFADLSAAVAEGDRLLPDVLAAAGLATAAWHEVSAHYTRLLAFDASGEGVLAERFAMRFATAQDALRPLPALTVEAWAELVVEVGARGSEALAARGLSEPDYQRLARHWPRALGKDRALAKRYHASFFAAAEKAAR